jgi:hypothetical protein
MKPISIKRVIMAAMAVAGLMLVPQVASAQTPTVTAGQNVTKVTVGETATEVTTTDQTVSAAAGSTVKITAAKPQAGKVARLKLTKVASSSTGQGGGGTEINPGGGGQGGSGQGSEGNQSEGVSEFINGDETVTLKDFIGVINGYKENGDVRPAFEGIFPSDLDINEFTFFNWKLVKLQKYMMEVLDADVEIVFEETAQQHTNNFLLLGVDSVEEDLVWYVYQATITDMGTFKFTIPSTDVQYIENKNAIACAFYGNDQ